MTLILYLIEAFTLVCDAKNEYAEIIEHSNCYSGAAWSLYHYAKAPLVLKARSTGNMIRYFMKTGTSKLELKAFCRSRRH